MPTQNFWDGLPGPAESPLSAYGLMGLYFCCSPSRIMAVCPPPAQMF